MPVEHLVVDKCSNSDSGQWGPVTQQCDALAAFDLHAQLQALLAVYRYTRFLPHLPAFTLEYH